jgi:CheY-like chemotaxis protein
MKTPQALIVEDVSDLSIIFSQALSAAGYEATCLADGKLAQTYLANHIPDLLVLDIHLPGLRGDILLEQIQKDVRFSKTKIIIVTADTLRGDELREDADLVLQKPVSYLQLRDLSGRLTAVMDHLHTKPLHNGCN